MSQSHDNVIVLRPAGGLLDLDLVAVWRYRELLYVLVLRDLQVRYKQAALGVAWAVLQPTLAVLIFAIVFGHFANLPSDGLPYPAFAFAAVLPWTYFSEAVRRSATGLVSDSELIRKVYFPRLIIPIAAALAPLVEFACTLPVVLLLLAWYGVSLSWHMLLLPFFVLIAFLAALAMGLWLGPMNVRFRDVGHTLPFVLQVWMYASPVVYPLSIVPERWQLLYSLNPMVGVIEGFRWSLLSSDSASIWAIGPGIATALVLFAAGLLFFRRMERFFADVI